MRRRPWTEDEIAVLRAHYARMQPRTLARLLGRSLAVLYAKAQALGLSRPPRKDLWTPEEEALLREVFCTTPTAQVAQRLGRTTAAVQHRANRLGLVRPAGYFESEAFAAVRGRRAALTAPQMLEYLRTNVRIDDDGCRIWAGGATDRLPVVLWNWHRHNARRLLLTLAGRTLRDDQVVHATCGKLRCMHEEHLRVGTRAQALRSKSRLGHLVRGTGHSLAIARARAQRGAKMPITERFNVARMRAQGWTWRRIADHYGVSPSCPQKQLATWERLFGPSAYWTEPVGLAA